MNKIKSFATNRPVAFGLIITFVYLLMALLTSLLGNIWPGKGYGPFNITVGYIIGTVVSISILMFVIFRFGWSQPSGFTSLGGPGIWLVSSLLVGYYIVVHAYLLAGDLKFNLSSSALHPVLILFIMIDALYQQVAFRGLVLVTFIHAWGDTKRGMINGVLISSLIFSALHLVFVLQGEALPTVLMKITEPFVMGVIWSTLMLRGKSIYPVILFHGIVNVAGYLNATSRGLEPSSPLAYLLVSLLLLPMALYCIYLLRGVPERSVVLEAT